MRPFIFIENHAGDRRRLKRVHDEGRGVFRPRNDVDLLALQLLNDSLNAAALHADTGADRIDASCRG